MINTRFVYLPADDDSVDPEYKLIGNEAITIQCAQYAGGYGVNEWREDEQAMYHHGIFRRLKDAQTKALEIARRAECKD